MRDINKTLEDLEDSVLKAEASYQIWWGLTHHGMSDYLGNMNNLKYVDFFHASIPIFLQSIFLNLSRVFDRAGDLSGVKALKADLVSLGHTKAAAEIEAQLLPHSQSIKSVKGIRDQSIGHKKHHKTTDQIYQENPLTPDQIRDLIEAVKRSLDIATKAIERRSNQLLSDRYVTATIELLASLGKK